MNIDEINKTLKLLETNLYFKVDCFSFSQPKKILIVEGQTDKKFIERILNKDVECLVANKAFATSAGFDFEIRNHKKAIVEVIYGLSKAAVLLTIPAEVGKRLIFGMIDRDFDDEALEYTNTNNLFITDTHDLETLILSTDSDVLNKVSAGKISSDDVAKAFCLAYQLGLLKSVLYDEKEPLNNLRCLSTDGNESVPYDYFVHENAVNVYELIKYVSEKNGNKISTEKTNRLVGKVLKNKTLSKKIDAHGTWKFVWNDFCSGKKNDFWTAVNGHDILAILRYLNAWANTNFSNAKAFTLNRDFEMKLIDNYMYPKMVSTSIYDKMRTENIIDCLG